MSLVVWLPFTDHPNATNIPNSGLKNIFFSNINYPVTTNADENSKLGRYSFRNTSHTSGGLRSKDTINLGKKQSMFCWFKADQFLSNSGLGGTLISQHRYPNCTGMGITLKYVSDTTAYLSVNTGNGSTRTFNTYCGTTLLQANKWYHGGFTYDGSKLKIYVNGVCENTVSISDMAIVADYLLIFCWSFTSSSGTDVYGNYKFYGNINDVRVYNHALSDKEVKEISKGLFMHFPLDSNGMGNANLLSFTSEYVSTYSYPSSGYSDKFYRETDSVVTGNKYTLSFWAKSTVSGDQIRTHFYSPNTTTKAVTSQGNTNTNSDGCTDFTLSDKWEKYWVTYTQSETTSVKNVICPRMFSSGAASGTGEVSIKLIKFEEGAIATPWRTGASANTSARLKSYTMQDGKVYDTSGNGVYVYGNYLKKSSTSNVTQNPDSIRYASCCKFNSSGYLISDFPSMFLPTDEITVNIWVKPTTWSNPISCTEGGGWNFESDGTYIQFPVYIKNIGYVRARSNVTPSTICDGNWHMLTGTYSQYTKQVKIYIDGVLKATETASSQNVIEYNSSDTVYLCVAAEAGSSSTPASTAYVGSISDIRIYATALSDSDIQDLYGTVASIDNNGNNFVYEFNESWGD